MIKKYRWNHISISRITNSTGYRDNENMKMITLFISIFLCSLSSFILRAVACYVDK